MRNLSEKNLLCIVIIGFVILCGHVSTAQNKWSAELRGGVNYATKKLGGQTLKAGYGFEGVITYRFIEHLAVYTGWSWNNFPSTQMLEGSELNFNETGYSAGLQFIHPFPDSNISYLVKVGGIYNHIETENSEGNLVHDTGHGFGWQAGVGLAIPLGARFNLIPEIRYRSLSRVLSLAKVVVPINLNYVSASIGLSFSF